MSGFSFINNNITTDKNTNYSSNDSSNTNGSQTSSFSFLNKSNDSNTNESIIDNQSNENISSFSFISSSQSSIPSSPYANVSADTAEIKLTKTASVKVAVKKKKRGPKVGFAREEDGDENEEIVTTPQIKSPIVEKVVRPSSPTIPPPILTNNLTPPPPPSSLPPAIPVILSNIEKSNDTSSNQINIFQGLSQNSNESNEVTSDSNSNSNTINTTVVESINIDTSTNDTIRKNGNASDNNFEIKSPENLQSLPKSSKYDIDNPLIPLINGLRNIYHSLKLITDDFLLKQQEATIKMNEININIASNENLIVTHKRILIESEVEQQNYAFKEEFDKADALSSVIENSKNKIMELTNKNIDLKKLSKLLESKIKDDLHNAELSITTACNQISRAWDNNNENIVETIANIARKQSLEDLRIKAEEERIALEKKHIDREQEALDEETRITEDSIKVQTKDITESKSIIELQLETVQREILDLEEQLAIKRNEERKLKSSLDEIDSRVNEVRKKFERQLQRLEARRIAHDKIKADWLHEESSVSLEKSSFDNQIKYTDNIVNDFTALKTKIDTEIDLIETFHDILDNLQGKDLPVYEDFYDVTNLTKNVDDSKASLSIALNIESEIHNKINSISIELQEIDDEKVPKLEIEKKSHAAAKRFKEAAAVAKELKTLSTLKEELEESKKSLEIDLAAQKSKVTDFSAIYEEAVKALDIVTAERDIKFFHTMLLDLIELHKTKYNLRKQQSKCKNIDSLPYNSVDLAVVLLDYRIQNLITGAKAIKLKYNLHDEIIEDYTQLATVSEIHEEPTNSITIVDSTIEKQALSEIADANIDKDSSSTEISEDIKKSELESENSINIDEVIATASEPIYSKEDAKVVRDQLSALNLQLQNATDAEDYDLAANIFESIESEKLKLEMILELLGCSEDEL